jgi:hypothetical protein
MGVIHSMRYCKLTAQDGTADAVAAQLAELPGTHTEALPAAALDPPPNPLPNTPVGAADTDGDGSLPEPPDPPPPDPPPDPIVEQVPPVGAALTQLQTAPAEVITASSDAAGQAVITQGTAAWEIDAYVGGLHWQA